MYPYPKLVRLLQVECDPETYRRLGYGNVNVPGNPLLKDPAYVEIVPEYLYARCPLCQTPASAQMDTYNILHNGFINHEYFLQGILSWQNFAETYARPCPHLLGTNTFINLHGVKPTEITEQTENPFYFQTGEVPYVTPWFLRDDIESYAILHALPVCRIEAEGFVPRYTLFMLTYFSSHPQRILDLHMENEGEIMREDPEYYPTLAPPGGGDPLDYDLAFWAELGLLGWLNYLDDELPLVLDKNAVLPDIYSDIPGRRKSFAWRDDDFARF